MTSGPEETAGTALVEVSPGTALVFGSVPDGLDLVPFRLMSQDDQKAIGAAIAATSAVLNVGGQLASGLAQAQGLVQLAPQTLAALKAGAVPVQSGGYNIGVLAAEGGKFTAQVRWLPVGEGVQVASAIASIGPALAMIAIQVQLHEISGLVKENLALTETVLRTVRHEQWAELTGLEQAVSKALDEASAVGHVTPLLWENVAGYEAALRKHRDLFHRHVEAHSAELAKHQDHKTRRQFIEKNGEAIVLDLYCLVMAHKSWFEYQGLRAGRARLSAVDDPSEEKLLQAIIENARSEHDQVTEELATVLDTLTRELWILAELPGKRTIPFSGARRSAGEVATMAQQMLEAIDTLSDSVRPQPAPLELPNIVCVDDVERLERDLRILRWHLDPDEGLQAIATASELGVGSSLKSLPVARGLGANDILIAVTEQRVLTADLSDFRDQGIVERSVPNDEIRYLRVRDNDPDGQAEVDLITKDDNLTWRFAKASATDTPVKRLAALLADHIAIPQVEIEALRSELPAAASLEAGQAMRTT